MGSAKCSNSLSLAPRTLLSDEVEAQGVPENDAVHHDTRPGESGQGRETEKTCGTGRLTGSVRTVKTGEETEEQEK